LLAIYDPSLATSLINMSRASHFRCKVFDPVIPEIEHESHQARFTIFKSLLPAQDKLKLTFFACFCYKAFPETRWIGNRYCGSRFWFGSPTWVHLCSCKLYQCATCFFTDNCVRVEFIHR